MKTLPKKPLFFSFFIITILSMTFLVVQPSQAVSYYNWVENPYFQINLNVCEDGGFESGVHNSGEIYGNWSGSATYSSTVPHSGVYRLHLQSGQTSAWYNFTSGMSYLGADILSLEFWMYASETYVNTFRVYYSDGTYSENASISCGAGNTNTWVKIDSTSLINPIKYVVAFLWLYVNLEWNIDDVVINIFNVDAQDEITWTTEPWYCGGDANLDMVGLNTAFGYDDTGSAYMGFDESTAGIVQDIDYMDSNTFHFLELYAYTEGAGNIGIKVNIVYSDRTWSTRTITLTNNLTWTQLVFSGFVEPNKYIVQIQILLSEYYPSYVNIDNVGLWSTLPAGQQKFSFSLSPVAIQQTTFSFTAYQKTSYVLTCYIYDDYGNMTESGNYQMLDDTGLKTGSFSNGQFSISLDKRYGTQNKEEQITIMVILPDKTMTFELTAYWIYITAGGDGGGDSEQTTNYLVLFIIVIVPALIIAFSLGNMGSNGFNGVMAGIGFIAGLTLTVSLAYIADLLPLWFVFAMIIIIALIFVAILHSKGAV